MSEQKNSTTGIDNNVQATPKTRLSRAEKARIESEALLKALGVQITPGRQTRSSMRGPVESPQPEPLKRKQTNTPRLTKKPKLQVIDDIDGSNHVAEHATKVAQVKQAETSECPPNNNNAVAAAEEPKDSHESNNYNNDQEMEVDNNVDETPSEVLSLSVQAAESPSDVTEETPSNNNEVAMELPKAEEEPQVLVSDGVSAAADTTTATPIEIVDEPASENNGCDQDETIELQYSASDDDEKEDAVSNSQAIAEPEAIVELDASSNESDLIVESANKAPESNSPELEIINSDSSLSLNDVVVEKPAAAPVVQEQTPQLENTKNDSTVDAVVEVNDEAVVPVETNNIASVDSPAPAFESTIIQKVADVPEKFCTAADTTPLAETITTPSEATLLEPNATTV